MIWGVAHKRVRPLRKQMHVHTTHDSSIRICGMLKVAFDCRRQKYRSPFSSIGLVVIGIKFDHYLCWRVHLWVTHNWRHAHTQTHDSAPNSGFHTGRTVDMASTCPMVSKVDCNISGANMQKTTFTYISKLRMETLRIWSAYHDLDQTHERTCLANARTCARRVRASVPKQCVIQSDIYRCLQKH